jgi:hypothetical protein
MENKVAIFNFYDSKNKTNVPCASFTFSESFLFARTGKFEHQFSDEIYFKKTEMKNEANQFVHDKWYKATEFEFHEHNIEVKNWIEKDPFKQEPSYATLKNSIQFTGNNITVTGNTFNLGDIQLEVFLKGLEASLEDNPNIPEAEKSNIVSKLTNLANNPYLSGILVNSIFNYIQHFLPKL